MPRYIYLYSNEGDDTIKNIFGGLWNSKKKRWRLPVENIEKVCEYLKSQDLEVDIDDQETLLAKSEKRKRKAHREKSFEESSIEEVN